MRTISISNQKGGCGKTTTAINLSGALASAGKKVLLIDMDPQSHASFGLGIINQVIDRSIYNVLTDNPEKHRVIGECIVKISERLSLVPSNILLSTLEQELKDKEDAVSKLHQAINLRKLDYDYAIIDCPPSLGFLTFNALRAADHIIVPIDMSAFSLMGVGKLLGMLELIKLKINHAPRISALATLFDRRTKYSQTMLDEIRGFFKEQMLVTIIRTSVSLKKAVMKGLPAADVEKDSNGAKDHLALAEELIRLDSAAEFERSMAETAIKTTLDMAVKATVDQIRESLEENKTETKKVESERIEEAFRQIAFKITAPEAREIYLVGDFNQWKLNDDARLSKLENGSWEKRLDLKSGRYKYKFVIDGQWVTDSQNGEKEVNSFGTFDSIIKI